MAEAQLKVVDGPRGGELAGLVRVPFEVAAESIALVEGIHMGIAERGFGSSGAFGRPARAVHDSIARLVYGVLRGSANELGRAAAGAARRTLPAGAQDVSRRPWGANLLGAVNGIVGDRLQAEQSPAAVAMAVRVGGRDLPLDLDSLASAYGEAAGPTIAVFVHGLCGSEQSWIVPEDAESSFPRRLQADLGYTPVLVRYNSGLHVSENGRALAALLGQLQAGWPRELREIVLIGHSMGGLVARSACHYGRQEQAGWTTRVRHVICLGSPHLGAPLEKAVNAVTAGFRLLPETRAFGTFLNRRSAGIKDLRFGAIVEEDWLGRDPDAFLEDRCQTVELLEGARHHAVAATITPERRHPVGYALGDLLVRVSSATGDGRRRQLGFDGSTHLGGLHHLRLLHHPAVYDTIRGILA